MAGLGWSADYMASWIRKMAVEDIKFIDVKPEVLNEFNACNLTPILLKYLERIANIKARYRRRRDYANPGMERRV